MVLLGTWAVPQGTQVATSIKLRREIRAHLASLRILLPDQIGR